MRFHSTTEAIAALQDTSRAEAERSAAIHFLADNLTPESIDILAQALTDDNFGVRWAAATALSTAGRVAFKPILRVVVAHGTTAAVREAAYHALCDSTDPQVRAASQKLMKAMKGAGADAAAPQLAFQLLREEDLHPA